MTTGRHINIILAVFFIVVLSLVTLSFENARDSVVRDDSY